MPPKTKKTKTSKAKKASPKAKPEAKKASPKAKPEVKKASPVKRVVDRDSVLSEFDALVQEVEKEIESLRTDKKHKIGIRCLRSLNKKIKDLRSRADRVMKQKKKTKRSSNTQSGFLKPVGISKELAKFTGWDPKGEYSRVEATKCICAYIREHDLQNPDDRRQIHPDKKLTKLLGYDAKKDEPLTYFRIQTYMKKHFHK